MMFLRTSYLSLLHTTILEFGVEKPITYCKYSMLIQLSLLVEKYNQNYYMPMPFQGRNDEE